LKSTIGEKSILFWDRNNKTIRISHHRYISDLLERVGFEGSKSSCGTPLPAGYQFNAEDKSVREEEAVRANEFRSVIGSLMYLAHWSRPDLMYSVSTLSSFCNFPSENHWRGVHHILSFLNATRDRGITYGCVSEEGRNQISAYADADYAGDIISRRSRTGYVVILNGGAVTWKSHLQQRVSQSSTEAEYYALSECFNEVKWITALMLELQHQQRTVSIYEDNTSAINIATNPISHPNTKQIEIRHHLIRDGIRLKEIRVVKIPTNLQLGDALTKSLDLKKFKTLTSLFMDELV
jgi:hypothetical protein